MTPSNTHEQAAQLRDGLRREREIYELLLETTQRQREILVAGRTDEILALARTKEEELKRVDEIEKQLAPLKKRWQELREQVDEEIRGQIDNELAELQGVLKNLIDLEMEGQKGIDRMRQETFEKLRQVEGGRKVQRAYTPAPRESPPRYLDRSS